MIYNGSIKPNNWYYINSHYSINIQKPLPSPTAKESVFKSKTATENSSLIAESTIDNNSDSEEQSEMEEEDVMNQRCETLYNRELDETSNREGDEELHC